MFFEIVSKPWPLTRQFVERYFDIKMNAAVEVRSGDDTSDKTPDISGVHIWLVLWKATHAVEEISTRHIKKLGMGRSDFGVLETLLHKGPQAVNEIGKSVLLTAGSMTTAIDRLQRRGFVVRKDHPSDNRTWIVHLTTNGRKWIEQAFKEHSARMNAVFVSLNDEERHTLIQLLKQVGKDAESLA